jgi:hypothetical protein
MADRSNSFSPPSTIGAKTGGIDNHPSQNANGTGGPPGTHEGHADPVPRTVPFGLGMGPNNPQSRGNSAARQGAAEAIESGSPYSPGSGNQSPPSAQ